MSDTRRPAAMRARECRERGPECVLRHGVTMKKRNKRVSVLKISETLFPSDSSSRPHSRHTRTLGDRRHTPRVHESSG